MAEPATCKRLRTDEVEEHRVRPGSSQPHQDSTQQDGASLLREGSTEQEGSKQPVQAAGTDSEVQGDSPDDWGGDDQLDKHRAGFEGCRA